MTGAPLLLALASVLVVTSVVDLRERRIPDACVLAILFLRLAGLVLAHDLSRGLPTLALVRSLAAGLVVGGFLLAFALATRRLLHAPGMGGGDLKLLASLACHLGVEGGLALVALSCLLALSSVLVMRLPRFRPGSSAGSLLQQDFAWAPAISVSALLLLLR